MATTGGNDAGDYGGSGGSGEPGGRQKKKRGKPRAGRREREAASLRAAPPVGGNIDSAMHGP